MATAMQATMVNHFRRFEVTREGWRFLMTGQAVNATWQQGPWSAAFMPLHCGLAFEC
jgi:hypothetical protein